MNNNDSQDQENDNESKTSNESQNSVAYQVADKVSTQYGITLQQERRLVSAPVGTANNNELMAPIENTEQSNAPKEVIITRVEQNLKDPRNVKIIATHVTLPEDTAEAEITPRGTVRFKRRRTPK